ncbi:MAG: hypothetical protein JST87_17020 [Bacteroidetes bacterium]|nr:hypothetical protein [Bacteroidota bacterium]MBS1932963.1 hypothetical protein [Bacteroidota bacterium]
MANPYRRLFNLFAFSVLAFAVYLNFFRTDDDLSSPRSNTAPQQSVTVTKSKSIAQNSQSDKSSVKEEKKN